MLLTLQLAPTPRNKKVFKDGDRYKGEGIAPHPQGEMPEQITDLGKAHESSLTAIGMYLYILNDGWVYNIETGSDPEQITKKYMTASSTG